MQKTADKVTWRGDGSSSPTKAKAVGGILHVAPGEENEAVLGGTKRTLGWLWRTLERNGVTKPSAVAGGAAPQPTAQSAAHAAAPSSDARPTQGELWGSISEVVLKTLLAVDGPIGNCPSAFELFGFDVILDDGLQPWVRNHDAPLCFGAVVEAHLKLMLPLILSFHQPLWCAPTSIASRC